DTANVDAGLAIYIGVVGAIAHQSAGFSMGAIVIHRWHTMTRRLDNKLYATSRREVVGQDQERLDSFLRHAPESRVDLTIAATGEDFELSPNGQRRRSCLFDRGLRKQRIVRVDKRGKARRPG